MYQSHFRHEDIQFRVILQCSMFLDFFLTYLIRFLSFDNQVVNDYAYSQKLH